ncbi:hypothetical protein [Endozoicomonas ascidiicola]|uniref:hypothetical protein n=1 Tax=Endozoicomonas ascidiicola TaxID=1698521 RepID=UPI000A57B8CA|nr:hypothetical protein [Endozoicomonas ascidiicola]
MVVSPKTIQGWKARKKPYYKTVYSAQRGAGSLVAKVRPDEVKEIYYRYKWRSSGGKETTHQKLVGTFSISGQSGITLAQAKAISQPWMEDRLQGVHVLEKLKEGPVQGMAGMDLDSDGLHRLIKIPVIPGSFGHMVAVYCEYQKNEKVDYDNAIKTIISNVVKPWPDLLTKKARDVSLLDLKKIIAKVLKRGINKRSNNKRIADVLRSYLSGMYRESINFDGDPMSLIHIEEEVFNLKVNLALLIKKQQRRTNVGARNLSIEELRYLWHSLPNCVHPVVVNYIRFMISVAGQRLIQVRREPWSSYCLSDTKLQIKDLKQSLEKFQDHIVYLNRPAMKILQEMRLISGHCNYPFPGFSRNGRKVEDDAFLGATAALGACKRVHKLMQTDLDPAVEPFNPGDFRRTCKTLMLNDKIDLKIGREGSNHVHNHGFRDVTAENYDCNDYEVTKRSVMTKWGDFLEREIINKYPEGWDQSVQQQ